MLGCHLGQTDVVGWSIWRARAASTGASSGGVPCPLAKAMTSTEYSTCNPCLCVTFVVANKSRLQRGWSRAKSSLLDLNTMYPYGTYRAAQVVYSVHHVRAAQGQTIARPHGWLLSPNGGRDV